MRIRLPGQSTSPIPHIADPAPLLPSPSSVLGLTASERRRRKQMSRDSSEPTLASGLANWRRAPKKPDTVSGIGTTGSNDTSGRKKGFKGVGMGMQGTPAKKGKRSDSKSMGAHSTPAAKILSRTQSTSKAEKAGGLSAESSGSSLGSFFPSSPDVHTLSPQSQIPDLSSPSLPAILASEVNRDVFDAGYILSPKARTSEERDEWDRLVDDAQDDQHSEDPPSAITAEADVAGLYGWKEDVLWSLRGSTVTTPSVKQAEGSDEPTIRQDTVYHDAVVSMNDNSTSSSPSSRTKARSSTIKNRQPTPHKPSSEFLDDPLRIGSSIVSTSQPILAFISSRSNLDSTNDSLTQPHTRGDGFTPDHTDDRADPRLDQAIILTQLDLTDPNQLRGTGSDALSGSSSLRHHTIPIVAEVRDILPGPSLASTPSTESLNPDLPPQPMIPHLDKLVSHDRTEPLEIGRTGMETPLDFDDGPDAVSGAESNSGFNQVQDDTFGAAYEVDFNEAMGGEMSDDYEPLYDPFIVPGDTGDAMWRPVGIYGVPVPYTPSSHLSPRSSTLPLSPISFATTRSPSVRISPTPPRRDKSKTEQRPQVTRVGAWRGAEVLARMEEAGRKSARYHVTYDKGSPTAEDNGEEGRRASGKRRRVSQVDSSAFEESQEVLEARRKRIEHYKDLELGYSLHVELVL